MAIIAFPWWAPLPPPELRGAPRLPLEASPSTPGRLRAWGLGGWRCGDPRCHRAARCGASCLLEASWVWASTGRPRRYRNVSTLCPCPPLCLPHSGRQEADWLGRLTLGHPLATSKGRQSLSLPPWAPSQELLQEEAGGSRGFFHGPWRGLCGHLPSPGPRLPAGGNSSWFLTFVSAGASPPQGTTVPSVPAFALVSVSCVFRPRWSGECQQTQPVCFGPRGLPPSLCWVPCPCGPGSLSHSPTPRPVSLAAARGEFQSLWCPHVGVGSTWPCLPGCVQLPPRGPPTKEKIEKEDTVAARG